MSDRDASKSVFVLENDGNNTNRLFGLDTPPTLDDELSIPTCDDTVCSTYAVVSIPTSGDILPSTDAVLSTPTSGNIFPSTDAVLSTPTSGDLLPSTYAVLSTTTSVDIPSSTDAVSSNPTSGDKLSSTDAVLSTPTSCDILSSTDAVLTSPNSCDILSSTDAVLSTSKSGDNIFLIEANLATSASGDKVYSTDDILSAPTAAKRAKTIERSTSTSGFDEPIYVQKKALLTSDDVLDHIGGNVYYYNRSQAILGQGVKSIVFEGRFGQNKRRVIAVKRIKCTTERDAEDTQNEIKILYSKINKKTIREVDMLESLSKHPNIVQFFDSYTDKHILYIAFEKAIGTLTDYVNESNESWRKSLKPTDVNRGVAAGLEYVHSNGIVHRDLKPANIFITKEYNGMLKPVIGDFGCAKATNLSMYSQSGHTGTSGFIAPEIWKALCDFPNEPNERKYTSKSDIFSEGIVFYYSLSLGQNPFGFELGAQFKIQDGKSPNFDKIYKSRNTIAHQFLLESMLHTVQDQRPKAVDVSSHPAMWTDEEILQYLAGKSDNIKAQKIDKLKLTTLEDPTALLNGNWMNNLPPNAKTYFKNYKCNKMWLYSGKETSVCGLLRAIRNTNSHYAGYPNTLRNELGDYPGGHVSMWMNTCPKLLMHVYKILGP